jgi:hypothetical protein
MRLRRHNPDCDIPPSAIRKEEVSQLHHNDFERGMLNGKLSALRWVLGDEWDMLDT